LARADGPPVTWRPRVGGRLFGVAATTSSD
jgi:hypothetical protein